MKKFYISIILLFISEQSIAKAFTVNVIDVGPTKGKCQFFFKRVFEKIGQNVKFIELPRVRGLNELNNGIIDGDCGLSLGFSKKYPNIIPIPEVLTTINIYLLGLKSAEEISSLDDLKKKRVGALWKNTAVKATFKGRDYISFSDSFEQLLSQLQSRRLDYIIYIPSHSANSYDKSIFTVKSPKLMGIETYFYIHNRHKHLKNILAKTIKETKQEAKYQKVVKELNTMK